MKKLSIKYLGEQLKKCLEKLQKTIPVVVSYRITDPASITEDVLFLPSRLDQDELQYLVSDKAIQVNGITYFKDRF